MKSSSPSPANAGFSLRLRQPQYWNTPSPEAELRLLERWRALGLRERLGSLRQDGEPYWLLDGPPYANGQAHLGHLLNKTLKDVFARFASLQGRRVLWRAGWDCHGLPLELAVEKRQGPGCKSDPQAFMAECRAEALRWQAEQALDMRRLGAMADFDRPWLTMDPAREAASLGLLRELWESGLLVERRSPVHWCPACSSALAASELERGAPETRAECLFLAPLADQSAQACSLAFGLPSNDPLFVMSWTTTPWTLWANAGFGMPESGEAALAPLREGRWALMSRSGFERLSALYPALFDELKAPLFARFEALGSLRLSALNPLTQEPSRLVGAPFASVEQGSGLVHLAPAFGPEDFELGEAAGLSAVCHVGPDGRLSLPGLPERLQGLRLPEASQQSALMLQELGLWLAEPRSEPEAPWVCWRHKKPVFYRASRQWALDLDKPFDGAPSGLRGRATAALERTVFLPDARPREALRLMLAGRRFWTLSRDRLWGLPLPFFRDAAGELHPRQAELWREAERVVAEGGVEALERLRAPEGYFRERQTADVWFDSGAALFSANEEGLAQADLGAEGTDQTRGWFLSSYLLAAFKSEAPPFKTLLAHGFVVDGSGHKLSKSKGGAPDHRKLFGSCGADALRLWAASQTVGDSVAWSPEALSQAQRELKDWRVFLRFMLANAAPAGATPVNSPPRPLDQLALRHLAHARAQWQEAMLAARPSLALQKLGAFRKWASSEWFELSKRLLYCAPDADPALAGARAALRSALELCLQMLSPFLPFSCEEAFLSERSGDADQSVFFATLLPSPAWEEEPASAAERALAWRRGLLPLVERARPALGKGEPVALSLFEAPAGWSEEELRDLFPGTLLLLGSKESLAPEGRVEELGVSAGRPLAPAWRCARCRGSFLCPCAGDLCSRCEREEAAWMAR